MTHRNFRFSFRQRGASIVEFAFIALMFFTLLFGIVEFGRLFFNINSVQEITRRAAREQVVRKLADSDLAQRAAVLQDGTTGTVYYPGAFDVSNESVQLAFFNTYQDAACTPSGKTKCPSSLGVVTPEENLNNCLLGGAGCVRFVRATLSNANGSLVNFNVLAPFMPSNVFPLPASTVIMPAEALGLL